MKMHILQNHLRFRKLPECIDMKLESHIYLVIRQNLPGQIRHGPAYTVHPGPVRTVQGQPDMRFIPSYFFDVIYPGLTQRKERTAVAHTVGFKQAQFTDRIDSNLMTVKNGVHIKHRNIVVFT